jgi:hypothetical protein
MVSTNRRKCYKCKQRGHEARECINYTNQGISSLKITQMEKLIRIMRNIILRNAVKLDMTNEEQMIIAEPLTYNEQQHQQVTLTNIRELDIHNFSDNFNFDLIKNKINNVYKQKLKMDDYYENQQKEHQKWIQNERRKNFQRKWQDFNRWEDKLLEEAIKTQKGKWVEVNSESDSNKSTNENSKDEMEQIKQELDNISVKTGSVNFSEINDIKRELSIGTHGDLNNCIAVRPPGQTQSDCCPNQEMKTMSEWNKIYDEERKIAEERRKRNEEKRRKAIENNKILETQRQEQQLANKLRIQRNKERVKKMLQQQQQQPTILQDDKIGVIPIKTEDKNVKIPQGFKNQLISEYADKVKHVSEAEDLLIRISAKPKEKQVEQIQKHLQGLEWIKNNHNLSEQQQKDEIKLQKKLQQLQEELANELLNA